MLNKVNFVASVDDHYSMGANLSDLDVAYVVGNSIGLLGPGAPFPPDTNGVFFVLTSPDVTEQEDPSVGGPLCAWHSDVIGYDIPGYPNSQDLNIKVAWVGNPNRYFWGCGVQNPSRNNNPDADSMASFVAHELEESVTDPDLNAWYDANGNENADLCVWTIGDYVTLPNGSVSNMKLGKRPYMIQRNWVNAMGGYCALSWGQ